MTRNKLSFSLNLTESVCARCENTHTKAGEEAHAALLQNRINVSIRLLHISIHVELTIAALPRPLFILGGGGERERRNSALLYYRVVYRGVGWMDQLQS